MTGVVDLDLDRLERLVRTRLQVGPSPAARTRARRLLEDDVVVASQLGDIPFRGGAAFRDETDRSRARFLHGFLFLRDWPRALNGDDDAVLVRYAVGLLRGWDDEVGTSDNPPLMAFHDETTAQRLSTTLALLPVVEAHAAAELEWVRGFADRTAALLVPDDFHAGDNNHGMFQDLALVSWAGLATWAPRGSRHEALDVALPRLRRYLLRSFTREGVHVENTPTYHVMVARHLAEHAEALAALGHPDAAEFQALRARLARYATHAVMPNGIYPPVSDTQQVSLLGSADTFGEEFRFAASQGASGAAPDERVLVLPESGYAVYRSSWGDEDATYLFFSCAYNHGYHKHADENSFVLRSGGIDLLSEAGPHGYNYDDPLTRHGYSQFAHNTVVVDGASIARAGGDPDAVTLTAHDVRPDGFTVTGRNGRLVDAEHRRTLDVREDGGGQPVIRVVDELRSDRSRTYELLWNLGPEVVPVLHGHGFELYHEGRKVMDAVIEAEVPLTTSLHRGELHPRTLGWRFPAFGQSEPADVVRVAVEADDTTVRTTFRLHDFAYRDRGLAASGAGWSRRAGEVNLNVLRVPASDARGRGRLVVAFTAIHQPGDFTYNYKATLDSAPFHALYVLDDFGDQGAYYLQDHGDRRIFRAVQDLLVSTLDELGLTPDDLVCIGSSKGGTAALLHGLAIGAGEVFVGAPQTRIGSFVAGPHPNILRLMTGGTGAAEVDSLDRALMDVASDAVGAPGGLRTRTTLLVGDADHHLRGHVLPFVDHLRSLGADPALVLVPGLRHADIGPVYRDALGAFLSSLDVGAAGREAGDLVVTAAAHGSSVTGMVLSGRRQVYAGRLFRGNELVATLPYSESPHLSWHDLPAGRYRVRVFARDRGDTEPTALTTRWVDVRPVSGR